MPALAYNSFGSEPNNFSIRTGTGSCWRFGVQTEHVALNTAHAVKVPGAVAQLGERQNRTLEVASSNLVCSTFCF